MKTKQVKAALREADADRIRSRSLLKNAEALEKKASEFCSHPKTEIRESWESGSGPPWSICLACGYAEEGWGIGGWKIPSGYIDHMPIAKISRNELIRQRRFFRTQRDITHEKICIPVHKKPTEVGICDGVCL